MADPEVLPLVVDFVGTEVHFHRSDYPTHPPVLSNCRLRALSVTAWLSVLPPRRLAASPWLRSRLARTFLVPGRLT